MGETLPDPALPIFGERSVAYQIVHPREVEADSRWETVEVTVDEIDSIEDPALRGALWDKFKAEERDKNHTVLVLARPDGSFSHAYSYSNRFLGVTFTVDGPIEDENLEEYRQQMSQERAAKEEKSTNWLARIFKKQR